MAVGASWGSEVNAHISVSVLGASIVPDKPRLLCVIYKHNYTHDMVLQSGHLSISILAPDQLFLIPLLGLRSRREAQDKMAGVSFFLTPSGDPVIDGCVGWLQCHVLRTWELGDATCFLTAVSERHRLRNRSPLWWNQVRPSLPSEWLEQWEVKLARNIELSRRLMVWVR